MKPLDQLVLAWVGLTSAAAFALFGFDKLRAKQPGRRRISEYHLVLAGALGGWLGGLGGLLFFRHKTAKLSFMLKYAVGFVVWAGLIYLWYRRR
jgi:uncharacterized membrane protein YsdA (DUF1294 family)